MRMEIKKTGINGEGIGYLNRKPVFVTGCFAGETAEVTFNISLDETNVNGDPYWMEFYMNSGEEGFCEFYFEAPAK